jgi:outer membrane usher protein
MRRFFRFLAVLLALSGAEGVAFAVADERAVLELIVNGATHGDVFVFLRADDVLVPLDSLKRAGMTRFQARTEELAGVPHVSLRAASPPLSFRYDERELTVSIVAPPEVFGRSSIDLAQTEPEGVRYVYDPSAFLKYAPRLVDGSDLEIFGEVGLSFGPALAESSLTWSPEGGPIRLVTKAVFDDRKSLRTATLGDSLVSTGPLGGSTMLGGLSVVRNFELDPYLVKIPRLGYTGSAMSPSTVDVYVNDVLVRRVPVQAGEFELVNITPATGAGTTRYVLRDAYGQEQRVESSYYASSSLLAANMSEYAYGIGFQREGFGRESFHYGEPMALARYRHGITDHLSTGAHAEFDRTRANAGSDVTLAGQFGEFELHTAGSTTTEAFPRRGLAGLLSYGYSGRGLSARTLLRGATPEFSTLSLDPDQERSLVEHSTTTNYALGGRTSLGTTISLAWLRNRGLISRILLSLNTRLSREFGLGFRAARSSSERQEPVYDAFATLTWSLPAHHFARFIAHASSRGSNGTATLSRALHAPTDLGYQLSASHGETTRGLVSAQAQSSFGKASATYSNNDGEQHTVLEASGSIVGVGGNVYFTRATNQSFAVLEVPGTPGVRGYVNNREYGTTDSRGHLFIPDLLAYQPNRLRIEQADLPADYALDDDEIVLAPPTHGGAIVRFPAHVVRLVRGSIARRAGAGLLPVKYGDLSVAMPGQMLTSILGPAGEFEIDGLPAGTFRGRVRSTRSTCDVTFEVKRSKHAVQDLGVIVCEETRAQPVAP